MPRNIRYFFPRRAGSLIQAGWLNPTRLGSMIEMASLPLTLVPLWIVPMLLAGHIYLFRLPAGRTELEKLKSAPV